MHCVLIVSHHIDRQAKFASAAHRDLQSSFSLQLLERIRTRVLPVGVIDRPGSSPENVPSLELKLEGCCTWSLSDAPLYRLVLLDVPASGSRQINV